MAAWISAWILCLGASAFFAQATSAAEFTAESGFVQLPASSYHYLAYDVHGRFGSDDHGFSFDLGMTHPFSAAGYTQNVFFGNVGWEWLFGNSFVQPFVEAGLGLYVDKVNGSSGYVPSLVTQGGVKIGGRTYGATLGFSSYIGIYDPIQLVIWTVWPMTSFLAGVYVRI